MLTERLARFVCETRTLPRDVEDAAKVALMDTLGCALAGFPEQAAALARDHVADMGARPAATVWGSVLRTAPAEAAFVNAVATHVLDFDDTLATLRGHASAPTLAVALAVAEQTGASAKAALLAYAIGIEVAGKLGRIFGDNHYLNGWHNTATVGIFAATAVAAKLRGDDERTLRHAWGIAAAECGGVLRNFGTMSKSFQAGHAARSAVVAEDLARRGYTANEVIFDGEDSFQRLYGSNVEDAACHIERLGTPWDLVDPGMNYKRWPCCYCSHRGLGGLIDLMAEHRIEPSEIEKIRIGFPPGADEPLAYDDPQTGLEGKFSIYHAAAVALVTGAAGEPQFADGVVRDPRVVAVRERVTIDADKAIRKLEAHVTVTLRDGRTLERHVEHALGTIQRPMSDADLEEKFRSLAADVLPPAQIDGLIATCWKLDALPDVGAIARAAAGT